MNIITESIKNEKEYRGLLEAIDFESNAATPHQTQVSGLCEGARLAFYTSLSADYRAKHGHGYLLIVPDEKDAVRICNAFSECSMNALFYPTRDYVFHDITASHEYEHERLSVLSKIVYNDFDVVVTTPDAALQYTMPPRILVSSVFSITVNMEIEQEKIINYLNETGYIRVEMVDGVGQFAVRGCVFDIYPPKSANPIRLQFFGDEIESVEYFDIITQRRIETLSKIDLVPSREFLIGQSARKNILNAVKEQLKHAKSEAVSDILRKELDEAENGSELKFADKYIALIYEEQACLFDYFDVSPLVVVQEYAAVSDRIKAFEFHMKQTIESMLSEGSLAGKYADFNMWEKDFEHYVSKVPCVICNAFISSFAGKRMNVFSFATKLTISYSDNFELLKEDLFRYRESGFQTVLLSENEAMSKNIKNMLDEYGIHAVISSVPDYTVTNDTVLIIYGINIPGFELTSSRFVVLSLYENRSGYSLVRTSGVKKSRSKKSSRERIMSYADLEIGDYVVHDIHGIGQYEGLESITHNGITAEYVKLRYLEGALLYIPTDKLDKLSKYIGARAGDGSVKLSRIGGNEWTKTKARVKHAAKEMAKELIALYAERERRPGFAFSKDDDLQKEFETAFEYEETDGQITAVNEIKRDMEKPHPMDRLLCGDVGFGKTEVALRAAFKAVSCGKQVAILVPTTILAMQHYQTILARMRGFPVKVDLLSRFRTKKQQDETLRRLRRGEIDIIVGTHRLTSKDVEFCNLGLLIVDEEQRFGVAQKEKIKKLVANIDVLTLTATPIPRTLNMAMSGIRDMSILEEAPMDRLPVQTYVLEYDEVILADALKKELRRGGQVFWLHNRVETIEQKVAEIQKMVPDARISFAHGKMDKEQISDIWRTLVSGEIDILVSTSIIETGVDVPNANTLVIEHADAMGLSQLHQMRGRVGRSSRRAYAYFTYPRGRALSDIAEKRLEAIRDFTEFGSGFKVALRDLEIRGAGNILGAEQHGNIDSIGYDLYIKLLNDAILDEKGEKLPEKPECHISLNYDAFIPERYMKSSAQRMDAYKKIASIELKEDYDDICDELSDRYGKMPVQAENLLKIALIRAYAAECGITDITQKENTVIFSADKLDASVWIALAQQYNGKLLMNLSSKPYISYRMKGSKDGLNFICELFAKYIQLRAEKI